MRRCLSVLLLVPSTTIIAHSGDLSPILNTLQTPWLESEVLAECSSIGHEENSALLGTTTANHSHSAHHHYSGTLPRQVHRSHEKEHTTAYSEQQNDPNSDSSIHGTEQCGIYLAPSTIPGAGLGLFAGADFEEGAEVTPGDAMIPLRDMRWHNSVHGTDQFLWDEYIWSGSTFKGMVEPFSEVDGASFGIGALPNCFFPLINVEDDNKSIRRDNAGLSRSSPSIGSFTPWHDRVSHAVRAIPAGEELFVDYGYGYFDTGRQNLFGLIPFLE